MSTSGIYNYRPKVDNPNAIFHQMDSESYKPPFFFGGSQVPVALNLDHNASIKTPYHSSGYGVSQLEMKGHGLGVGLKTTHRKNDNIRLTKYMFHK
jgi:hypothetical protein